MSNLSEAQFGNYTLTHTPSHHDDGRIFSHLIEAHHKGKKVGELFWYPKSSITTLHVDEEHRRKGLATAMYAKAKSIDPDIHHADQRTEEGDAWSQSQKDYTHPNEILGKYDEL